MKPIALFITLLLFGGTLNLSFAASYKWTDESGNIVYSQHPPAEGIPYTRMDKYRRPGGTRYSKPPPGPSASTTAARKSILDAQKNKADANKVNSAVAQADEIRKKNCAGAKKNLEIYTVYRRIKDDKGNVSPIDDNVRQQKINEAKQAIKEFCK